MSTKNNRTKKMQLIVEIIGVTLKKHELLDIINMNDVQFEYFYQQELNEINSI
tara:strand:- start:256 stop:414 length:159 start_codon:yes stop_codon:yes gene_type:complete